MLNYKAIEIFTNEDARYRGKPIADAVLDYIRNLKIAARCIVTRGIAGCYESGEVSSGRVEVLSFNLPIRIYIVLPAAETQQALAGLDPLVANGIIVLHDLIVVSHKADSTFFPRQLTVRDVMTPDPARIAGDSPVSEAARLLLSSIFTGLPVVDAQGCPVGVVTQGDLIIKGGLPLRLGLLAESEQGEREAMMAVLAHQQVQEIMTSPAVSVQEDRLLTEAVDVMLTKKLKRLPVIDKGGRLVGILSRLDIFKTVMREAPDWDAFRAQQIEVKNLRTVKDILRRDTHTVLPDTTIDKVIQIIDGNDIQCVAVVNDNGTLIGMISDSDLLHYFKPDPEGLRALFSHLTRPAGKNLSQRLGTTTAFEVMCADLLTVQEDMLIEDAIRLMTEKRLKRLPVIDDASRFKGMISRDSLLRTGYGRLS
jgi:CBS-domain-containing membrane protein/PII-like signaling protein